MTAAVSSCVDMGNKRYWKRCVVIFDVGDVFDVFAAWNSLPDNIKLTTDTNRFKRLIKSYLFYLAF